MLYRASRFPSSLVPTSFSWFDQATGWFRVWCFYVGGGRGRKVAGIRCGHELRGEWWQPGLPLTVRETDNLCRVQTDRRVRVERSHEGRMSPLYHTCRWLLLSSELGNELMMIASSFLSDKSQLLVRFPPLTNKALAYQRLKTLGKKRLSSWPRIKYKWDQKWYCDGYGIINSYSYDRRGA